MQISEINYEKRYAYAEVEAIIHYMGEKYINKLPKDIMSRIKAEKRQNYTPDFDFSKPLMPQVKRQETINLIAYLYLNYWCENEEDKKKVLSQIEINTARQKEIEKRRRMEEVRRRAAQGPIQSLDAALKAKLNK